MSGVDPYAEWDAAYVLGALGWAERAEYEEHLASCARCQASVSELAGMPGLLAQVPPGEALSVEGHGGALPHGNGGALPAPPRSLMPPSVVSGGGGASRRHRWVVPVASATSLAVRACPCWTRCR